MILEVRRKQFGESTIGELYVDGHYFCDTLEDKVRELNSIEDKVYGQTAIPSGVYRLVISFSNRFGSYMPLLLNVPYFSGIRIHPGNTKEHTHGCILVGTKKGDRLINSRLAYNKLMKLLKSIEKTQAIVIHINDY